MEQKRIKVRLTENSPYSDYGYYKKGDIGYIDGYVNDSAVIILENGKFAKADLRWIEVVNEEDKNVNTVLKESEDERIRKALLGMVHDTTGDSLWVDYNVHKEDAIAWLEKQGEQEYNITGIGSKHAQGKLGEMIKNLKSAWSEEDERIMTAIFLFIESYGANACYEITQEEMLDWLKSLKERYTWKPSDEQMNALNYVVNLMASSERPTENDLYYNILKSLRQQLMKLKDEK